MRDRPDAPSGSDPPAPAGVIFRSRESPYRRLDRETSPHIGAGHSPPHPGGPGPTLEMGLTWLCFERRDRHPMFRADPFSPTLARGGDAGGGAGPGAAGGAGATRYGAAPGPQAPPAPLRDAPGCPEPPSAPVIPPRESDTGAKQRPSRAAG
ncbi:circumsporozoite protein-like [Vidua macroura]|uniref:circumsporozoite protein-like n=1 Tax=Vidua macroura TaxID=187451 RepID=UPI0023A81E6F|nr:circumsporozoite protein-like [Vidua macroura]